LLQQQPIEGRYMVGASAIEQLFVREEDPELESYDQRAQTKAHCSLCPSHC
jgi:hypothetical protein